MAKSSVPSGYWMRESRLPVHGGFKFRELGDAGDGYSPMAVITPRTFRGVALTAIGEAFFGIGLYGRASGDYAIDTVQNWQMADVWRERAERYAGRRFFRVFPDVTLAALAHVDPGHMHAPKDRGGKPLRRHLNQPSVPSVN